MEAAPVETADLADLADLGHDGLLQLLPTEQQTSTTQALAMAVTVAEAAVLETRVTLGQTAIMARRVTQERQAHLAILVQGQLLEMQGLRRPIRGLGLPVVQVNQDRIQCRL